jgi:hypothetical protein
MFKISKTQARAFLTTIGVAAIISHADAHEPSYAKFRANQAAKQKKHPTKEPPASDRGGARI